MTNGNILAIDANVIIETNEQESKITPTCYEEACDRDERTKSAKYFRNALLSRSRSLPVNSMAVSSGQPCEGRKADKKKSCASCPLVLQTIWRKLPISN